MSTTTINQIHDNTLTVKFINQFYSDYNLIGIALIENANTIARDAYSYCIVIGKGTCKPETQTGRVTETIISGASVSSKGVVKAKAAGA